MVGLTQNTTLRFANTTAVLAGIFSIGSFAGANPNERGEHNQLMQSIYYEHVVEANATDDGGKESIRNRRGLQSSGTVESLYPLAWKNNDWLLVSVSTDQKGAETTLKPYLEDLGFETTACSAFTCSGYLDIAKFPEFDNLFQVVDISPSMRATNTQFGSGSVFNGASTALGVDALKALLPSFTGAGIRIGVMSDSFDNNAVADFTPSAADDIATGDIPDNVFVVKDTRAGGDEGRAMIQLIHDLAPGAELYFRTAFDGPADFAAGIFELADLDCDIIVDDINYFNEPFFQDGIIAQAANDVAEQRGIPYFSSAGNRGRDSWETGAFAGSGVNGPDGCEYHDFGGGQISQRLTVAATGQFFVTLEWDQPFNSVSGPPGTQSDLNIFLLQGGTENVLQSSTNDNIGGDAFELVSASTNTFGTTDLDIRITYCAGPPPSRIQWITMIGIILSSDPPTIAPTLYGHPNTQFAAGVAAAYEQQTFAAQTPIVETFSSPGGIPILFDRDGNPISEVRPQPRFTGTDGSSNTFFGDFVVRGDINNNGRVINQINLDTVPRFFGTSAAAPNVAAVASLLLQANPGLTPLELYQLLSDTAIDMEAPGFDFESGAGLVNANAAVNRLVGGNPGAEPTLSPAMSPTFRPARLARKDARGDDDDKKGKKKDKKKKGKRKMRRDLQESRVKGASTGRKRTVGLSDLA